MYSPMRALTHPPLTHPLTHHPLTHPRAMYQWSDSKGSHPINRPFTHTIIRSSVRSLALTLAYNFFSPWITLFEPEILPRCADIVPEVAQRCSGEKGKRYCCSPYAIILQNAPYSPLFVQTHRLHAQQAMQSLLSAYGSSSSESDSD